MSKRVLHLTSGFLLPLNDALIIHRHRAVHLSNHKAFVFSLLLILFFLLCLLELQHLLVTYLIPLNMKQKNAWHDEIRSTNVKRPIEKETHALRCVDNWWLEVERRTKCEISINCSTISKTIKYMATNKAKATSHFTEQKKNCQVKPMIKAKRFVLFSFRLQNGNIGMTVSEWVSASVQKSWHK